MSAAPTPRWRQAYDHIDRVVTPAAEQLVRTSGFARAAALATSGTALSRRTARAVSSRWWHQLNLPAATDVAHLRREIGALDREVRRLTLQVEHQQHEETDHADRPRTDRRPVPGPARRRAQPPPDA